MCLYFCTGDFIFNLSCKPLVPGLLLFLIPSLRMRDLIIDIPRSCVYYCANRSCGLRPSDFLALKRKILIWLLFLVSLQVARPSPGSVPLFRVPRSTNPRSLRELPLLTSAVPGCWASPDPRSPWRGARGRAGARRLRRCIFTLRSAKQAAGSHPLCRFSN